MQRRGTRDAQRDYQMDRAQDMMYDPEHWFAWIITLCAIACGIVGILGGFNIMHLRSSENALMPGIPAGNVASVFQNNFWDAAMLEFSAITGAILAFTLHASDHHRMTDLSVMPKDERMLWGIEHTLSYVFVIASIVLVIIGLLVGFQAFSGVHDQGDGLKWIWLGLGSSVVALTLHSVRHHQTEVERDYIIGLVEDRVGQAGTAPGTTFREPGTERTR